MPDGYPILLDVSARRIVVVGGGLVAMRKIRGLLEAGATRIVAISPEFHEQFPDGVQRVVAKFEIKHLEHAQLVFAATNDSAVNHAIVAEAARRGILVNRADASDEHPGDFSSLASRRMGGLTLGISAGGNPAIAAAIRDELADHFKPHWTQWISAVSDLRELILAEVPPGQRAILLKALASPEASAAVEQGGEAGLRLWFNQRFAGALR